MIVIMTVKSAMVVMSMMNANMKTKLNISRLVARHEPGCDYLYVNIGVVVIMILSRLILFRMRMVMGVTTLELQVRCPHSRSCAWR